MEERIKLMLGDNMKSLKELPNNSVDSIVTDPPYGLSFMNKKWDYDVPTVEFWSEVYRVLKPGGHVLSFGGTRTYHRMAVNIEDAGFEIRDQIMWIYGSGFPKSHNIGKAIDKIQDNEREVIGDYETSIPQITPWQDIDRFESKNQKTKGNGDWEGWGTALKPANEPICVARKPLSEKSVAENVLKWGTGGLNIDASRIGFKDESDKESAKPQGKITTGTKENVRFQYTDDKTRIELEDNQNDLGRFPANVILECICDETHTKQAPKSGHWSKTTTKGFGEFGNGNSTYEGVGEKESGDMVIHTNPNCPCYILNQQSGISKGTKRGEKYNKEYDNTKNPTPFTPKQTAYSDNNTYGDEGGASRFFYVPKVSKKERNRGLDELPDKDRTGQSDKGLYSSSPYCIDCGKTVNGTNDHSNCKEGLEYRPSTKTTKNTHPTVKPINLLTYLVRLVTPKNGVVMDCFMGSGSTGIAAQLEGFKFIGMEMDEDYFNIAEARINAYEEYRELLK